MRKWKEILLYPFQTMLALYLIAFIAGSFLLDLKASKWHAYATTLSRLQPPYEYLTQFSDGKVPFDRKQFLEYRLFFKQLLRVLSDRPDGYGMLGYCEYQLGNTASALEAYKKAVKAVPSFVWFNYNLGLIYFQKHDYEHAVQYLTLAVQGDPDITFKFMAASKVYLDALASVPGFQDQFTNRLQTTYRDSYKMLVLSYFHLQRYNDLVVVSDLAVNQKLDDDGLFYYYLGVGAYFAQQFDRAVIYLQEAIKKNPESPETYYYLALTLKGLGKEEMAVIALEKSQILGSAKGSSYSDVKNLKLRVF